MSADSTVPKQRNGVDRGLSMAVAGHPPSEQVEIVERGFDADLTVDSVDWVFGLAEVYERENLSLDVVRRSASGLSWKARHMGQRMPNDEDWERCLAAVQPALARRLLAYAHGFRLKSDFKFDDLEFLTSKWLSEFPDDALIQSLATFAALGKGSERAIPLLARVSSLPDYDRPCRAVCLQGLWVGTHLEDQAERVIALSDEMIGRGEDNANLYYWRAYALRRSGRLDQALSSVDRAIGLLPAGMISVHQDYMRERELINTSRIFGETVETLGKALSDRLNAQVGEHLAHLERKAEEHAASAQRVVSESLLRTVEILALFVTLTGFLVMSGALVLSADSFGQSAIAIALLSAGAIGFFAVLRAVVRLDGSWVTQSRWIRWFRRSR